MSPEDEQAVWSNYYAQKLAERLDEARDLWVRMRSGGVTDETVLALDFVHFGSSRADVEALAARLSDNYSVQVLADRQPGYWIAKGTTRPGGITLDEAQHLAWVEFMASVSQSCACVFSTWSLEAPSLRAIFESDPATSRGTHGGHALD